jgi:hypothetical protein
MNVHQTACLFLAGLLALGGSSRVVGSVTDNPEIDVQSGETKVVVRISKQLFDDLVKDTIEERTPIDQFALGARSIGVAETSAQFRITLEPLAEEAKFLIQVTGQARASTVAHTRPVQVRSGSRTDFEGHAFVHYDGWEFHVPDGEVTASSEMWLEQITPRRRGLVGRLIRRIASRSVDRKRPQALNLLRETTKARVGESFDQSLDELERELQQVTPLEQTVNLLFPETKSWVCHLSTTTDYLQAGVGPKDSVVPELPQRGDRPMQAAVELWVRLPADAPKLDGLALLWNGAQRVLNGLSQDNESTAPDEIHAVEAIKVGPWWVFDLHTATTRTGTAVTEEPQSRDQRAKN